MSASVAPRDVDYDDFKKDVDATLDRVDERAVRVHRPNHDDVVVTTDRRISRQMEAIRSVGRIYRGLADGLTASEALVAQFAWASSLPAEDVDMLMGEIAAVGEHDDIELVVDGLLVLLDQWYNTALVWADTDLHEELTAPVCDHGPVVS